MRVLAPGKVVLSGAYAVLEGAPGVVAAVDRYAVADTSQGPNFVTPEVRTALVAAGIPEARAPWVDAEALRADGKKIGLGSSAALLVASLGALQIAAGERDPAALPGQIYEAALRAHRQAQGGGSGIDVAASTFGGLLRVQRDGDRLLARAVTLPGGVYLAIWAAGEPASTSAFLAAIRALASREPELHARLMRAQFVASVAAADALDQGQGPSWISALDDQGEALFALGRAAGIPIVTEAVRRLQAEARKEGGVVIPSGAGGGDIALFAGQGQPSPVLLRCAADFGYQPLSLVIGARGVHAPELGG